MTNEENSTNKDRSVNKEGLSDTSSTEEQVTEAAHFLTRKDDKTSGEEVSQSCCNSGEKVRGMLYFFLFLPIVLAALYYAGAVWFFIYPSYIETISFGNDNLFGFYYYPSFSIFNTAFINAPIYLLYFLALLFSCYFDKPLSIKNRIISIIVISCIWAYVCMTFFEKSDFAEQMNSLFRNSEPIFGMGATVLFLGTLIIACYAILVYDKSKHSVRIDLISCTALCVVYIVICNFFIREGGLIYLVPFREKYTVTEDFPVDKHAALKSFLKFAELNGHKERFFHPEKQISYEDLLEMATISPSLLKPALLSSTNVTSYPKFYVRYMTNEILYPLSEDLAQKEH